MTDDQLRNHAATEALQAVYASSILPTLARILFQKDTLDTAEQRTVADWIRECPQKASMGMRKVNGKCWAAVYSLPLLLTSEIFLRHVDEDPEIRKLIEEEVSAAGWSLAPLARVQAPLAGEDETLRSRQGGLGSFIGQLLLASFDPAAEVAVLNSGAFRIDRNLEAGEEITEKTLHDIFYHDNQVQLFELDEATLVALADASSKKRGTGEYLQFAGVPTDGMVAGGTKVFRVVATQYVAKKFLNGMTPLRTAGEIKTVLKDRLRFGGR